LNAEFHRVRRSIPNLATFANIQFANLQLRNEKRFARIAFLFKKGGKSRMPKTLKWSVPVPKQLDQQLEEYIQKDTFKTKSEFIRTAVRDRLERERAKLASKES